MKDNTENFETCAEFRDKLAELSLGMLSGIERSAVVDHVESCERCAVELAELSFVTDSLLQLAPEVEPPVGFESRLAERLQQSPSPRSQRRVPRVVLIGVAAAVSVLAGVGIGMLATSNGANNSAQVTAAFASAPLVSKGHALGEVYVTSGKYPWLYMAMKSGTKSSIAWCEVTLSTGQWETVGKFRLSHGYGAWGAPLARGGASVQSARVIDSAGNVIASANLVAS